MEHIYDGAVIGPDTPISPFIQAAQNVPRRQFREVTLNSKYMDEERKLLVYIPTAYNNTEAHNLIVQLDGQNYSRNPDYGKVWQGWTPTPTILDNVIYAGEVFPTVAVMVLNQGRRSEDMPSEKFTDFIA
ncbi:alpha/beta hydrolase-fold protein [Microbulbifer sp. 2304DJ12-6]|uniref:alpha/beta hydrolase-fold protein n=1 Tax=Microbulbifer sp. 2304DJ12-6 TaxID=3233340 RepID=UPI0039B05669